MIVITVNQPGSDPVTHRFDIDRIRIGREADNDLVLESDSCSRYHAEILSGRGQYKIVDLNSTNGILIDGQRVREHMITSGDEVELGEYTLSLSIPKIETPKTTLMPTMDAAPEPAAASETAPAPNVLYINRLIGRGGERTLKIAEGVEYVIGRSPSADMVVDDAECSGKHASVFLRGDRCTIRDLDSANGTFVNDEQVQRAEIRSGDRLVLGRTQFSVSEEPPQTDEEDILLARTKQGFTIPAHEKAAAATATPGLPRGLKWGLAVVAVVALLVIAAAVTWRLATLKPNAAPAESAGAAGPGEVMVQVEAVEYKELVFSVTAAGTVTPQKRVTVSAEVGARVLSTAAGEGAVVRRGDQLVRLDDRENRLQIQEASWAVSREQVDLAKSDFERKERLFADGAVTRSALDQAKNHYLSLDSAYKTAQARIAQLRERSAKTNISSPLTGVVARLLVEPGEFVGPGTPLAVIEDMEEVLVVVEVADRDVVRLRPLQVIEATTDAYPGRVFQGVIERVGNVANPVTRSFEIEARIGNPDGELRSGMITTIRILLDKRRCLVVPGAALLDERESEARVILVSGGTARSVEVGIGSRQDRDVELLQGLAEGDEVVVYGHDQVRDGQPVTTYREN